MSQDTLRADAQGTLLAFYGGEISPDEQGFSEQQVMFWLVQERDRLMERDIDKNGELYQPDDAYFSPMEVTPEWDNNRGRAKIALPSMPPTLMYDRGIRLEPVIGGGAMFVRVPRNFCNVNPDLAFLEGNWAWEMGDQEIIFPNMRRSEMPGKVMLNMIMTKSVKPDEPLRLPARHRAECRNLVLQIMGGGRQDTKTDGRDANTGGQQQ